MGARTQFSEALCEKRVRKVHQYLRTDVRSNNTFLKRPFIFEFTGTPSAGKTTTITELDKFFRRMGLRVLRPQEGAEVIRHIERTAPLYNIRTALYAVSQLVDHAHSHTYDLILFDRCAFDPYCWMMYWEEKGRLSSEEKKLYQDFFLSPFWASYIDGAYFMICDAEIAIQRELKIALSRKLGGTTNPESIRMLEGLYRRAYKQLRGRFPQLKLFNATHLDERRMVEIISDQVLSIMENKSAM